MTGASGLLVADSAGQQVLRAAPRLFPEPAGSHAAFQRFFHAGASSTGRSSTQLHVHDHLHFNRHLLLSAGRLPRCNAALRP